MTKLVQWVNLKRNAGTNDGQIFVDAEVTSKERVGELHYEIVVQKPKAHGVKVRVYPAGGKKDVKYSRREKRFLPFQIRQTRTQHNQGKKKTKIEEGVLLPAAGGNSYYIEGKSAAAGRKEKLIEGKKHQVYETWRRLYYEVLAMADGTHPEFQTGGAGAKNLPAPVGSPATGTLDAKYKALFLSLKRLGGATFTFKQNLNGNDATEETNVLHAAGQKWTLQKYEPWAFAAVIVNQIANQAEVQISVAQSPVFTIPAGLFSVGSTEIVFPMPNGVMLWYGVDDVDDQARVFLAPNGCKWVDAKGVEHDIPDANVTVDTSVGPVYTQLKIKVPWSIKSFFSKSTGRFKIKVRTIDGYSGGYALPGFNLVIIARRSWYVQTNTDADMNQILVHEVGHKVGMVPYGSRMPNPDAFGFGPNQLDAGAHLYGENYGVNDQGHQGPHCQAGSAVWSAATSTWSGVPGCVMWGATGYMDAAGNYQSTTADYCGDCKPVVRKLDIDASGLQGFTNSIRTK